MRASLLPAEWGYGAVVSARNRLYDAGVLGCATASVPVISIGNLSVGGTGKTPLTAWLAGRLRERGRVPAIVLRGYGEDEVRLHRELNGDVPVVVAPRRADGVADAVGAGADCILLDDGFQHRALRRDLDIVLVAAERWSAERRLLPRGPYREPVGALGRAGFVVVTRKTAPRRTAEAVLAEVRRWSGGGVAIMHLGPGGLVPLRSQAREWGGVDRLAGRDVVAVTSMAEPELFAEQLRESGARVTTLEFPDHHPFTDHDVRAIVQLAQRRTVVVSRKEAVKLRGRLPADADVLVLEQRVEIEMGREELERAVDAAVEGRG